MSAPTIPAPRRGGRDLLGVPILGSLLRWRHLRTALQSAMLAAALLVIYDGLTGSPIAPRNLAGVAPWVQWRGFTILSLLVAGSLFCTACPFVLVRRAAKVLLPADRAWPVRFRGKWLAAGLLAAYFWFYETFDPWALPWLTAALTLAYFAGAFLVDGLFKGAAFCKYLCPIGQFNFVNSLCSPLEVRVRSEQTCRECTTKDCIAGRTNPLGNVSGVAARREPCPPVLPLPLGEGRGEGRPGGRGTGGDGGAQGPYLRQAESAEPYPGGGGQAARPTGSGSPTPDPRHPTPAARQTGCELFLFQQQKGGNLDCTFCLDCVHACSHDNVGVMARLPIRELWDRRRRSGIGRLEERADLAFLALIVVFGAFVNAFGMVGPFYALERRLMAALGTRAEWLALSILFGLGLLAAPVVLVGATSWLSRLLAGTRTPLASIATRFSYSLVPLGFGMWAAHYGFHFLTGGLTLIPVVQSFLADLGMPFLGTPRWDLGPLVPDSWLLPIELALLEGGLLGSLIAAYRLSLGSFGHEDTAKRAFVPWALLAIGLAGAGVWLMLQPMEMRGTLRAG